VNTKTILRPFMEKKYSSNIYLACSRVEIRDGSMCSSKEEDYKNAG
jgi:hypothetical protein